MTGPKQIYIAKHRFFSMEDTVHLAMIKELGIFKICLPV